MICYLPWILLFPRLGEDICLMTMNGPLPSGSTPFHIYLTAFLATFLIELLVMSLLMRRISKRLVFAVLCANLLTHPFTVYVWLPLAISWKMTARQILLGAELVIPFIEALVYMSFSLGSRWKCLVTAIISNLASWILIAVLQVLGWWF